MNDITTSPPYTLDTSKPNRTFTSAHTFTSSQNNPFRNEAYNPIYTNNSYDLTWGTSSPTYPSYSDLNGTSIVTDTANTGAYTYSGLNIKLGDSANPHAIRMPDGRVYIFDQSTNSFIEMHPLTAPASDLANSIELEVTIVEFEW